MSFKVVLITGTSTGIGLATAVAAAQAGWRTVATVRDLSRADGLRQAAKAAGVEVDIRSLDVTDESSVAATIDSVMAEHGRIDAVVNNAGTGLLGTLESATMTDVRQVMEVDFFGVLHVSKSALPCLRASGGRLVTVSSVGGVVGQPFMEAYSAAKFAVEGYMESLAPVAATLGVSVSVIEPGAVDTKFIANLRLDAERAKATAGPYATALTSYVDRVLSQFSSNAQSPDEVAGHVLEVLAADCPAFRIQTSEWARSFTGTKLADLDGSAVLGLTSSWVA